jgi:hypothetical protein
LFSIFTNINSLFGQYLALCTYSSTASVGKGENDMAALAQMLMVGTTRYFARGMELGMSREAADRMFIITTVGVLILVLGCINKHASKEITHLKFIAPPFIVQQ